MIRKTGLLLMVLVALLMAACGGAGGGGGGGALTLSETFEQEGLTFKYPSGWVTDSDSESGTVFLANSQDALNLAGAVTDELTVPAGQQIVVFFAIPAELAAALGPTGTSPADILNSMATGLTGGEGAMTVGDVTETTIGGQPAARASATSDAADAQIIVRSYGDDGFLMMMAGTAKGEMGQLEATLNAIAESATVAASG
jgi:predicted Zn-dependent protease